MATALGVVIIVATLIVSIALHEAGHLATAKHYGMRATQYFIGFGPRIFSFRRGETEYGVKALLAGGYVKIVGMSPLEAVDGQTPEDMRAASAAVAALPTHTQADERRLFYTYPARQRSVVLVAGSAVHFLLAGVLTFVALAVGGNILGDPGVSTKISAVSACASTRLDGSCPPGAPLSPAARAGLRPGDVIVAVNGTRITDWSHFVATVKPSANRPLVISFRRDGVEHLVRVTPVRVTRPSPTGHGTETVGVVGLTPADNSYPGYNLLQAIAHTPAVLGKYVTGTISGLARIPASIPRLIEGKPRTSNGLAGPVDIGRIGGAIAASHQSLGAKAGELLLTAASINFFVGVFNLLPLLPLDGGHIAIIGFESLRAWIARRRQRPDPGRVDLIKILPIAYAVVAAFVGLSLLLLYAGIVNPIQGT